MKTKTTKNLNKIGGALLSITPLTIITIANAKVWFTAGSEVSISIGAILALVMIVLSTTNKIKIMNGMTGKIMLFVCMWLLRTILSDILVIYGAYLLGDIIYRMAFKGRIERLEMQEKMELNGEINAKALEKVIKETKEGNNGLV